MSVDSSLNARDRRLPSQQQHATTSNSVGAHSRSSSSAVSDGTQNESQDNAGPPEKQEPEPLRQSLLPLPSTNHHPVAASAPCGVRATSVTASSPHRAHQPEGPDTAGAKPSGKADTTSLDGDLFDGYPDDEYDSKMDKLINRLQTYNDVLDGVFGKKQAALGKGSGPGGEARAPWWRMYDERGNPATSGRCIVAFGNDFEEDDLEWRQAVEDVSAPSASLAEPDHSDAVGWKSPDNNASRRKRQQLALRAWERKLLEDSDAAMSVFLRRDDVSISSPSSVAARRRKHMQQMDPNISNGSGSSSTASPATLSATQKPMANQKRDLEAEAERQREVDAKENLSKARWAEDRWFNRGTKKVKQPEQRVSPYLEAQPSPDPPASRLSLKPTSLGYTTRGTLQEEAFNSDNVRPHGDSDHRRHDHSTATASSVGSDSSPRVKGMVGYPPEGLEHVHWKDEKSGAQWVQFVPAVDDSSGTQQEDLPQHEDSETAQDTSLQSRGGVSLLGTQKWMTSVDDFMTTANTQSTENYVRHHRLGPQSRPRQQPDEWEAVRRHQMPEQNGASPFSDTKATQGGSTPIPASRRQQSGNSVSASNRRADEHQHQTVLADDDFGRTELSCDGRTFPTMDPAKAEHGTPNRQQQTEGGAGGDASQQKKNQQQITAKVGQAQDPNSPLHQRPNSGPRSAALEQRAEVIQQRLKQHEAVGGEHLQVHIKSQPQTPGTATTMSPMVAYDMPQLRDGGSPRTPSLHAESPPPVAATLQLEPKRTDGQSQITLSSGPPAPTTNLQPDPGLSSKPQSHSPKHSSSQLLASRDPSVHHFSPAPGRAQSERPHPDDSATPLVQSRVPTTSQDALSTFLSPMTPVPGGGRVAGTPHTLHRPSESPIWDPRVHGRGPGVMHRPELSPSPQRRSGRAQFGATRLGRELSLDRKL